MFKLLRKLRRNQPGATAIEYGLIAALLPVGAIAVLTDTGVQFRGVITRAGTAMAPTE
jgi:pilus assembly protein Flp/PilA